MPGVWPRCRRACVSSLHAKKQKGVPVITLVQLLVDCGLCKSKGEVRRLIKSGGIYVNEVREKEDRVILLSDFKEKVKK